MKQPKKLTRAHKEYLRRCDMEPRLWMLQFEDAERCVYVHKVTGQTYERTKHK